MTTAAVHFKGHRSAAAMLRAIGWQVHFDGLPALQGVLVVYPHTSNWDFIVGLLTKWAIGLPLKFWGKDSLFGWPLFGRWMRSIGGIPVERGAPQGAVQAMAANLQAARERGELFWLALSPEGTRAYRAHWRSGFYHLALAAGVPIGVVTLDWGRRTVRIMDFLTLSGDAEQDFAAIASRLQGVRGRRPELAAPISLASP